MATFRELLKRYQDEGKTDLYSVFEKMYDEALTTWLPQLGESGGSHQGIPHLRNVEANIDAAAPDRLKEQFSPTEVFILLASVLLHDIGKVRIGKMQPSAPDNHAQRSCRLIQKRWAYLRFPKRRLANWCAIITCSHNWPSPRPPRKCGYRDDGSCALHCEQGRFSDLSSTPDTEDGRVRLAWLAALLRLGDETDNKSTRAIAHWLRAALQEEESKPTASSKVVDIGAKEWRREIQWVEFDPIGECIRFRCTQKQFNSMPARRVRRPLKYAIMYTDLMLKNWRQPFLEMDLRYRRAFVDLQEPDSVLLGMPPVPITKNPPNFQHCLEPSISENLLQRVSDAMINLDNSVIGNESFTWQALAGEAKIENVNVVRLAVRRLRAIALARKYYAALRKNLTLDQNIIFSTDTWQLERPRIPSIQPKRALASTSYVPPRAISTGLEELDKLLCPEDPSPPETIKDMQKAAEKWQGGFFAPSRREEPMIQRWLSPIIIIEGRSGLGKTVLSLQIACNLARAAARDHDRWLCLYYSLEQGPARLRQCLEGFGWFPPETASASTLPKDFGRHFLDLSVKRWYDVNPGRISCGQLMVPGLSPVGWDTSAPDTAFKTRYQELLQAIHWVQALRNRLNQKRGRPKWHCFFVVDSLNAFSSSPLTRNQIHTLFGAYRYAGMPLLVTHESQDDAARQGAESYSHYARYLADIGIRLETSETEGYTRQTIEVTKSRYSRRILGKHQFKLKSHSNQPTHGFDDRSGVVIYPSIHYYLSQARKPSEQKHAVETWPILFDTEKFRIRSDKAKRTKRSKSAQDMIKSDSCLVVSGPHGGHKFALAFNLLLSSKRKKNRRKLIISLSEEKNINLKQVAMFKEIRSAWGQLLRIQTTHGTTTAEKIDRLDYGRLKSDIAVTVINFRMGQIMPEEFLYIIDTFLDRNRKIRGGKLVSGYDSILFADTAQLRTRFPGLAGDDLFLPALVDIVKTKGLYSVFIDVEDEDDKPSPALLAAADCRIFVAKHLEHGVIMHVNNVRGKIYETEHRPIDVKTVRNQPVLEVHDPVRLRPKLQDQESRKVDFRGARPDNR